MREIRKCDACGDRTQHVSTKKSIQNKARNKLLGGGFGTVRGGTSSARREGKGLGEDLYGPIKFKEGFSFSSTASWVSLSGKRS